MSIKHSLASKARWSKLTEEQKFARMSKTSNARWSKTTKKERKEVAFKLVEARKQKQHERAK